MVGATWSGGTGFCWNCESNDNLNLYEGFGGTFEGHLMNQSVGHFHGYFDMNEPIPSGQAAFGTTHGFLFRLFPETGNAVTSYDLFEMFGANGESDLSIDRDARTLSFNHTWFSNLDTSNDSNSFTFSDNQGLLISRDEVLGPQFNCIGFNLPIPLTDRNCNTNTTTMIEADQTGTDPALHFHNAQHSGQFKFEVLNSGGTGYDTPVTITDTQMLLTGGTLPVPAMDSTTPVANQVACVKAVGPPIQLGTCSTVVSSSGACTCN
jgi:hypothetical protein